MNNDENIDMNKLEKYDIVFIDHEGNIIEEEDVKNH